MLAWQGRPADHGCAAVPARRRIVYTSRTNCAPLTQPGKDLVVTQQMGVRNARLERTAAMRQRQGGRRGPLPIDRSGNAEAKLRVVPNKEGIWDSSGRQFDILRFPTEVV